MSDYNIYNDVTEIRNGNQAAFERVYYQLHENMYFYVLKQTRVEDIAEEVVQQAFIKLWECRENLSPDYSIAIQLARITRTTMIDTLRKAAVERSLIKFVHSQQPLSTNHSPILQKELHDKIEAAIHSLPPVCKKVFKLSRQEGLSHKEIAEQLSISTKTVENHIAKALKLIREVALYTAIFSVINK